MIEYRINLFLKSCFQKLPATNDINENGFLSNLKKIQRFNFLLLKYTKIEFTVHLVKNERHKKMVFLS